MKHLSAIAGALLGLMFIAFSLMFFLNLMPPQPAPPAGSYPALFMGAFVPSGYLAFVKSFELLGGVLVAIPYTRNLGLLVLGPIIINILAYNALILRGEGMLNPITAILVVLPLILLFVERKAFLGLVRRPA
jgi:putative oxidoreductase